MKRQLMKAPDGLWCVFIHAPFAEDFAERSLEAEPVLYIEAEEYVDPRISTRTACPSKTSSTAR